MVYEDITPEECDGYFGYSSKLDDKYELGPRIGRGAFGTVRLARHREEGLWYAIKAIPKVRRESLFSLASRTSSAGHHGPHLARRCRGRACALACTWSACATRSSACVSWAAALTRCS